MTQKNTNQNRNLKTEWILSNLIEEVPEDIKLTGKPEAVKCKYGNAVSFNGFSDGMMISKMPLAGLENFTIELIFNPKSGGNFEQRFLHCGETQGDRVLLELRASQTHWYFDAFIKTGDSQLALIDVNKLHPLDQWYHVAYIKDNDKFSSYVNGIKELEGEVKVTKLTTGQTSVGMRQNEVSWFKGEVFSIRITPEALDPKDFMKY